MGEGDPSFDAVEKIKVTGSTYMAAVGLESARRSSQPLVLGGGSGTIGHRQSVFMAGQLSSSASTSSGFMSAPYRRTRHDVVHKTQSNQNY